MAQDDPTLGETVDFTKTAGEAIATGGASLAEDPMATLRAAQEAPKVIKKGIKWQIGCCALEFFVGLFVLLFFVGIIGGPGSGQDSASGVGSTEGLSGKVPTNFAKLFNEAGTAFKLDPAIIAAIYLTEHHTDSFGKDIPSLDAVQSKCTANGSGALGPMQIIDGTWKGVVPKLEAKGITSPDRCKYRDAIYGGAAVIRGKINGQPDTKRDCKVGSDGSITWTEDCVKSVGRAYCGACTGPACGTHGYNYCEQTLKHYDIAKGSLTYIVPWLINDKRELICSAVNTY